MRHQLSVTTNLVNNSQVLRKFGIAECVLLKFNLNPIFRILNFYFKFFLFKVVNQYYAAKVFEEDVIYRNNAIFKCLFTPAFIIDFLEVERWFQDDVPIKRSTNGEYGKLSHHFVEPSDM